MLGPPMTGPPTTDTPREDRDALPEPGHLDRPLDRPSARTWLLAARIGAAAWLAFLVLVPLRYYVLPDHDPYDERFAWRMFSAVRVQRCEVVVDETLLGEPRPVRLTSSLPMPWIALVERNRPAVQRGLLDFRCAGETEPSAVEIRSSCVEASGERAPTIRRTLDCGTGELTEEVVGGAQAGEP
jgi:hypothetical protein